MGWTDLSQLSEDACLQVRNLLYRSSEQFIMAHENTSYWHSFNDKVDIGQVIHLRCGCDHSFRGVCILSRDLLLADVFVQ